MRARKYFSLSKRERELKKKYQNYDNDPSVGSFCGMKLTQEEYSEPLISSTESRIMNDDLGMCDDSHAGSCPCSDVDVAFTLTISAKHTIRNVRFALHVREHIRGIVMSDSFTYDWCLLSYVDLIQ